MSSLCTRVWVIVRLPGVYSACAESDSPFVQCIAAVIEHWVDLWGWQTECILSISDQSFEQCLLRSSLFRLDPVHLLMTPPTHWKGWWSELLRRASHSDQCLCRQLLKFLILVGKSFLCRQYNYYLICISLGLGKYHLKERKVLILISNWPNSQV